MFPQREVHTLDKRSAAPKRAQLDSLSREKRGMRRKENPATSKNDGVARGLTAPPTILYICSTEATCPYK